MSVNSSVHPLEKTLLVSVSLGKISRSAIDENMANAFVVWKILLNFSLLTVVLFCFPIHQYIKVPVLLWSYHRICCQIFELLPILGMRNSFLIALLL